MEPLAGWMLLIAVSQGNSDKLKLVMDRVVTTAGSMCGVEVSIRPRRPASTKAVVVHLHFELFIPAIDEILAQAR